LAALIDHINSTQACHIMTLEDPIEFVHENQLALINQREIAVDSSTFASALKHVLRQDPDVILIGEMRDAESASVALTAAETGHLVFTCPGRARSWSARNLFPRPHRPNADATIP
jgi:twitching motility protein PilT